MSPPVPLPRTVEERAPFLQQMAQLEARTVSSATGATWTDREVQSVKAFLDENGVAVGEFSAFHMGLGSRDSANHSAAIDHYRRQLTHAALLDARCVGFSVTAGREAGAEMWSDDTWHRCVTAVAELARLAEQAGVDVAAHPHIVGPLNSVDRYLELLETVNSPRLRVLMDPVNLTWPRLIFETAGLIHQVFDELGRWIVALHAKDVTLSAVQPSAVALSVLHLDEAVPGTGELDYRVLLRRLDQLEQDVTVHVEHFSSENLIAGQRFIRQLARELEIEMG